MQCVLQYVLQCVNKRRHRKKVCIAVCDAVCAAVRVAVRVAVCDAVCFLDKGPRKTRFDMYNYFFKTVHPNLNERQLQSLCHLHIYNF